MPKLPLLLNSSPGAVETCAQLLHGMPRRRATAEPNAGGEGSGGYLGLLLLNVFNKKSGQ